MQVDLLREAEDAEDVAAGLKIFLDALPTRGADISLSISSLFAISSALRGLDGQFARQRNRTSKGVVDDLALVIESLQMTLEAVNYMFGLSGTTRSPGVETVYDDLCSRFRQEEGPSLGTRLDMYKDFLQGILQQSTG